MEGFCQELAGRCPGAGRTLPGGWPDAARGLAGRCPGAVIVGQYLLGRDVPDYHDSIKRVQEQHPDLYAVYLEGDVYIYNFPDRTGYEIEPQTILRLAKEYPNIAGCKDTIPGVAHTREIIKLVKPERPHFKDISKS